tara:strand:- start:117 stop:449 length:333 start_codon:yes stop_codon:yes gene_type:complete
LKERIIFFSDEELLEYNKLINNYIRNNWDYHDLRNPKILNYGSLVSKSITWKNISFSYVNKQWNFSSDLDYAILDKDFPINKLDRLITSKTKISPNIHNLRKSDAYIYSF